MTKIVEEIINYFNTETITLASILTPQYKGYSVHTYINYNPSGTDKTGTLALYSNTSDIFAQFDITEGESVLLSESIKNREAKIKNIWKEKIASDLGI